MPLHSSTIHLPIYHPSAHPPCVIVQSLANGLSYSLSPENTCRSDPRPCFHVEITDCWLPQMLMDLFIPLFPVWLLKDSFHSFLPLRHSFPPLLTHSLTALVSTLSRWPFYSPFQPGSVFKDMVFPGLCTGAGQAEPPSCESPHGLPGEDALWLCLPMLLSSLLGQQS